jgi:hypothetical protein
MGVTRLAEQPARRWDALRPCEAAEETSQARKRAVMVLPPPAHHPPPKGLPGFLHCLSPA